MPSSLQRTPPDIAEQTSPSQTNVINMNFMSPTRTRIYHTHQIIDAPNTIFPPGVDSNSALKIAHSTSPTLSPLTSFLNNAMNTEEDDEYEYSSDEESVMNDEALQENLVVPGAEVRVI
jgi:hypothetical protein